jgi:hypothetical protein
MSSTSADLAIGKKFIKKLLYVQDVSTEVGTVSEIPELFLQYFGHQDDDRKLYDLNFAQYLKSSKSNVQILKPICCKTLLDGFGSTPILLHLV